MALQEEVETARQQVITDGFGMSFGELISLYIDDELIIDPVFQRLFRWDIHRKTKFIESLILGIPIPPVFVYQDSDGIWELVDGLQHVSTVLQFLGDLHDENDDNLGELVLNGTKFLPSLDGKRWAESAEGDGIGTTLQREIKRARVRVEILKLGSAATAKFELLQRLNTGGARLTEQEVRSSIAVSLNRDFYDWMVQLSGDANYNATTRLTDKALESQKGLELVLRFLAFRNIPYVSGLDVHEYLDDALLNIASDTAFNMQNEGRIFIQTFDYINAALGALAFQRWNANAFLGMFLMSVFEVLAIGVSLNLDVLAEMTLDERNEFLMDKARGFWENELFTANSGAGVRGTTRLSKLLPQAADMLCPS